jgi:hypothetical protein
VRRIEPVEASDVAENGRLNAALGFWAAVCTASFGLLYVLAQLLEWAGVLGSGGGPDSPSTASGLAFILTPSLLLGPAFVAMIAALHVAAPPARRAFTLSALAFATIYATLNCVIYFGQLTFVAPRLAAGRIDDIRLLLFIPYKSFLFAVDLLGYSFMSLSTLFAAFGLPPQKQTRAARIALIANGLLLPALALQMYFPALIWIGALWAVTFPASAILLARLFAAGAVPSAA